MLLFYLLGSVNYWAIRNGCVINFRLSFFAQYIIAALKKGRSVMPELTADRFSEYRSHKNLVTLMSRADETVPRRPSISRLSANHILIRPEQVVGIPYKYLPAALGKDLLGAGVHYLNDHRVAEGLFHYESKVKRGDVLPVSGKSRGIDVPCTLRTNAKGFRVHQLGKGLFGAGDSLCKRYRCRIDRPYERDVEQVLYLQFFTGPQMRGNGWRIGRFLANRNHGFGVQPVKNYHGGDKLRRTSREEFNIRIF